MRFEESRLKWHPFTNSRAEPQSREGQGKNPPLSFSLRGIDPTHPYLAQRGITTETAALFGIGFYGQPGIMRGRVVIPVHNQVGGREGTERIAAQLEGKVKLSIVTVPDGNQPDQVSAAALRALLHPRPERAERGPARDGDSSYLHQPAISRSLKV